MENERKTLHKRLLDAVRACQTHLGGKNEMVTEASSWVSCLCTQFEAVLQHQLKSSSKSLSIIALRQASIKPGFEDITFWQFIKNHLTKHEVERFESLTNISTDLGRGRAWIRSSLNEHSLDRYFLILLSDSVVLRNFYEQDAFMLDEEKSSTLSQMAAGLGTIYFNIKINDSALNGSTKPIQPQSTGLLPTLISSSVSVISKEEKLVNEENLEAHCTEKSKIKIGKKKKAKIISFGDEDEEDLTNQQGAVKPAEKGGPGFVVLKQPLSKSTNSLASDSSSGVLSCDGQLHGNDQHSRKEVLAEQTSSTPPVFNETHVADQEVDVQVKAEVYTELNIHSGETLSDSELKSQNADLSLPLTDETSQQLKKETKSDSVEDLSEVTKHLMSVRHPSIAGGHDLVMDDWSVRSNSVSGTPVVETAPAVELHPMQEDYDETVSSDTKSDVLHNDSASSASCVLSSAGKSPNDWKRNITDAKLETKSKEAMSSDEMREALVVLMQRKNELTETNKSTRSLLDSEMEHSAALRRETEKLKSDLKRQKDEMTTLQQQHIRENEVLRNQLKKYVKAVQALQRGDSNVEMPAELPRENNESTTSSIESEVYEQKLVEVAEMHGELMEFNERLHVRLQSAMSLLHNMKTELIDLRGPMPNDDLISRIENGNISGTSDYSPPLSRALINIWIPSSFLKGKGANAHHVFQVYARIGDEEWNIYRRYSQFHELHLQLRKKYSAIDSYGFPPKKVMGNKGEKFVEDRRKGLQLYLRLLMNNIVQNHEKIVAKPNKDTLTKLIPFFSESLDIPDQTPKTKQKRSRRSGQ